MDLGLEPLQQQFERLAKLPRAYRLAMLPAIVAVVAGAYAYFLYMPVQSELESAQKREMQLRRKLSEVRSVANNEQKVKQEIEVLERKLDVALRQLPDSKELPVLLTDITTLGKDAGLDFRSFRPRSENKREFYAEVPIDIAFTGRFHDVARFFDEVSRLPRIVNIGDLQVKIAQESSGGTVLSVDGQATTFRFLKGSDAGNGKDKGRRGR